MSINPHLRPPVPRPPLSVEDYVEGIRAGDRVVLGRAITLVESTRLEHRELARQIIDRCLPHAGRSLRVGITGVPGVGKSTFIEALGTFLVAKGRPLAVLAVDPSSELAKGSILGDKTRMPRLAAAPNAFIRPSPAAGTPGGVARATREAILLCEAAGFDTVFVETVGVGQAEVAVHALVDFFLLLVLSGAGDALQGIKRGIIEMADAIAVTKADGASLPQAAEARAAYRDALSLFPPKASRWRPRVLTCSALTGDGIAEVWEVIEAYRAHTQANGFYDQQRRQQARRWMLHTIERHLREDFFAHPGVMTARPRLEEKVTSGAISPFEAAQRLLEIYHGESGSADPS